ASLPTTLLESSSRSTRPSLTTPGKAFSSSGTARPPTSYSRATAASASYTGIPSFANIFAVSVLPMPIEPVSPTMSGLSSATDGLHKRLAQPFADLGSHTEERLECGDGLMNQHPQPVDRAMTATARILEQLRLDRVVDEITNHRIRWERFKREGKRRRAPHAAARCIDHNSVLTL